MPTHPILSFQGICQISWPTAKRWLGTADSTWAYTGHVALVFGVPRQVLGVKIRRSLALWLWTAIAWLPRAGERGGKGNQRGRA